jgi:hypothetical protein
MVALGCSTGGLVAAPAAAGGFPARWSLADLDAQTGFVLRGVAALDEAGKCVSAAGDWNGDGLGDVLIGAPAATRAGGLRWVGEAYVVFGSATPPAAPVWLGALDGSDGVTFVGQRVIGFTGMSVSSLGDLNHDGIDDLVIGAGIASPNFIPEIGESYVVFGTHTPQAGQRLLESLDGSNGFNILGLEPPERMGTSVSAAGDFNGDGIDDVVLGANSASPDGKDYAGVSYVVFGSSGIHASDLSQLNGSNGMVVEGLLSGDFLGNGVSDAGDFNADGFGDLVLGAPRAKRDGKDRAGEAYLVFGGQPSSGRLSTVELDGGNGFAIEGTTAAAEFGSIVSQAGDVNDDGFDDILVAAPFHDLPDRSHAGQVMLLFGSDAAWPAVLSLASIDATRGRILQGPVADMQLGIGVGAAGDVNDDGIDDFIVGAPLASPHGRQQAGEVYVVFGDRNGFPQDIDLTGLDGDNGFVLEGIAAGDRSGWSVAGAGDVNDDGIDDLVIGAPGASRDGRGSTGEVYVVFGRSGEEVAVWITELSAGVEDERVQLHWTLATAAQRELRHVVVQRRTADVAPWETVSPQMPARPSMSFVDALPAASTATWWYRLVLTDHRGTVMSSTELRVDRQRPRTRLEAADRGAGGVTLRYSLARPSLVTLQIFDVRGRLVWRFPQRLQAVGQHTQFWDTSTGRAGGPVATGVYFVSLRAGADGASRKLLLATEGKP